MIKLICIGFESINNKDKFYINIEYDLFLSWKNIKTQEKNCSIITKIIRKILKRLKLE